MKNTILLFVIATFSLTSCLKEGAEIKLHYYEDADLALIKKHLNIADYPEDYTLNFPVYYRGGTTRQFDNGLATLGRVLFYDKNLSSDRTVSCASCHQQTLAFSDNKGLSDGVETRSTTRNSLALGSTFNFNEYYGHPAAGGIPFFWDNRAFTVAEQSKQTLGNPKEMNMDMNSVVQRVTELEYYRPFFSKEFDGRMGETQILSAISEFVNAIGSFDSKFDKALTAHQIKFGNTESLSLYKFDGYNDSENRGKTLFMNNCGSCHGNTMGRPPVIAANNGLYMDYEDNGVGKLTNQNNDLGMFKVPTLRNIALTGPYMHNGSLKTLEDVMNHYSNGIQNHKNLSKELKSGPNAKAMNFSSQEKADLVAFLNTMTDNKLLSDVKYSDPFKP